MNRFKSFIPSSLRGGGETSSEATRLQGLLAQAIKVQDNGFKKSISDTRSYRSIILPNKLQALLISDPKTEKAAGALTVNVGSYSDPYELPGLAHFLEHMLFMGTEKYPDENNYSKFLSENGGYSNAYTASELTNYQFEVISGQLAGALDRFAQFFIKPLLKKDATDREMKAVDNECSGNQQNDSWRGYLIYRELAHEGHPIHKFNIGNLETLRDIPKEKNIDVREALLKFYNKFYSANRMKLVVCGKESLDELETMVTKMFSDVPNKDLACPYVHPDPNGVAFDSRNLKKFVKVVPVKDIRRVEFTWILKRFTTDNKRREAISYLGSLLGDEGEGSILSYLKQQSWANALSAGASEDNYDLASFDVTVHCTDLGITEHVNDIIEVVYNYINMLLNKFENKEESQYFFEEQKIMSAINYWFKSDTAALRYATNLASKMQKDGDINDLLTTGYLNTRDSFQEVVDILKEMKPENSLIFVSAKSNADIADREETYFKTKFKVEDIPDDLAAQWVGAKEYDTLGLKLTTQNKFIPSKFDVAKFEKPTICKCAKSSSSFFKKAAESTKVVMQKTLQHSSVPDKISIVKDTIERDLTETWEDDTFRRPIVIHSDEFSTVWLKQDTTHDKPKAVVKIFVKNPAVNENLFAGFATSLYISLMEDTLNEQTYAAQSAGFGHSIGVKNNGVVLTFLGFAETIYRYIDLVANKFKSFSDEKVDPALFLRFKEQLLKNIINTEKARPVSLAAMAITQSLIEKNESLESKLKIAKEITLEDVLKFAPKIFENVALEILVAGNAVSKDAMEILKISKQVFTPTREVASHDFLKTVKLTKSNAQQNFYIQASRDPENPGSAMCALFQFGTRTDEKMALLSCFSEILHEEFFNKLRTQQTLGYIVQAGFGFDNGVLSLKFYVESNSADPVVLNTKLEEFLDNFEKEFENLFSKKKFQDIINAELNSLLQRSNTVASETGKWWGSISGGLYTFENGFNVAKAMTNLNPDDLSALLKEYLWVGAPKRSKFFSGMLGDAHGKKLFGQETYEGLKPQPIAGVRQAFDNKFVVDWLKKDEASYEAYVATRGDLNVVQSIEKFKADAEFYPTYKDILAKL